MLDLAGVTDLWERDNPQPIYTGEAYAMPLVGADELDRHLSPHGIAGLP